MAMDRARSFLVGGRTSVNLTSTARRDWPTVAGAYELLEECGRGVSATVWRAKLKETGEEVAVKLLDLENINCSLEEIVREAQTMRQQAHPNVLSLHCSFVHDSQLWMVMPYLAGGSVLNLMKYAYPEGLEEPVIATILKEVLKALDYMHRQGAIHRDVKAGNILIDSSGQVLLADFGVAATMERGGSWGNQQLARNTFVGTPCWMAPEVMEQTQGYNSLADIWSFGITILELAHGHAPFARLPPMKVLLMTIQSPPPTLESDSGKKHFSKAMRDIVAKCLVKDPAKRPSAAALLEHKFFKTAHDASYLVKHLLGGLPSVTERVRLMRAGKAGTNNNENQFMAAQSQEAYVRGVSAWNFDVAAMKATAAAEEALLPVPEASELNGGLLRGSGDGGSGAISPISKPGTPVPGAQGADFAAGGGISRTSSSAASQAAARPGSQAGTPGKERAGGAGAAAGVSMKKKQGRFEVYEGDMPLSPPVGNGAALMEQHQAARAPAPAEASGRPAGSDTEAKDAADKLKVKSKGRFQVVENEDKARAPKAPSEGSRSGVLSPVGTQAKELLPPLRAIANDMRIQQERLQELVGALGESERGRHASLLSTLAQFQERNPAELATSKTEAERLREENARLHQRIRVMEEELQRARIHGGQGPKEHA